VRLAARLAARRLVDGLVTAPISKKAWGMAGVPFKDHTEFLREETGRDAEMILGVPARGIWCVLATRHIPLRDVPGKLSVPAVLSAARALSSFLRRLGDGRPRLGLCALNPHAGEEGLLGWEEDRVLAPASAAARRQGLDLAGPIAADTAWRWHLAGRLDGLVALYHDQALIPLKAAAGLSGINWTAGLPFVRVSPAHGTGFDIAGLGRADCSATLAAAQLAVRLLKNGKS
jgi:4-hydroxythreonine-4-phosphate dehydrogenase